MSGRASDLRQRHGAALDGFVHHPLFRRALDGSLSAGARNSYFVNERYFVGAARGVFAHLLIAAPGLDAARHLVRCLDGLVNDQEPWFDRLYATLDLHDPATPAPAALALADGMTRIAREEPYVAGLSAMLAAEWSYREIARRFDWQAGRDPAMASWMILHADAKFASGVDWLEREIEAVWTEETAAQADAAFARAIALELAFHSAPLLADDGA